MQCPSCSYHNPGGARFCTQCGSTISRDETVVNRTAETAGAPVIPQRLIVDDPTRLPGLPGLHPPSATSGPEDPTRLPPPASPQGPPGAVWTPRERPSYTPTIVVTIFFGIFGLWPAIRHSRMARERGHTSSGYWWWFGSIIVVQVVASILLYVLTLTAMSHFGSPTPAAPPTANNPAPPAVAPAQSGSLALPPEGESDAPAMVVAYMDGPNGIFAKMFESDNAAYLDHYFSSSSDSGYVTAQNELSQGVRINQLKLTNLTINSASVSVGSFTAEFDVQADGHHPNHHVTTYTWNNTTDEWRVYSVVSIPAG
jgi:hypothetical protein